MNKNRFLQFGLLGVMFAAVIVGFATRQNPKKATPSSYSFYYYPKANVYFNKTDNNYAFLNESGTWQVAKDLPASKNFVLDKKVDLTSSSAQIWKDNDRHKMVYAVSLYAEASDLKEPSAQKVQPPPPAKEEAEEKEKPDAKKDQGVKGFFKKLFKKKKEDS